MKKVLYLDLSFGISLDMLYNLLLKISNQNYKSIKYLDLKKKINKIDKSKITNLVLKTYELLGKAESKVHKKNMNKDLHFHEIGRDEAIIRIENIYYALSVLNVNKIIFKNLSEGKGKIKTKHGLLDTPVPVNNELLKAGKLKVSINKNIKTEILTPSALAILITFKAKEDVESYECMLKKVNKKDIVISKGNRKSVKGGLTGFIL